MSTVADQATVGIGFVTMPHIFDLMPFGQYFAACLYFLLFLAGVTSSLSMLQPAIAFFEEGFGLKRHASVTVLGILTFIGSCAIILSPGLTALDTIDTYSGNIGIPLLALFEVFIFVFVLKVSNGIKEAAHGADMKLPRFFGFVITYITPVFLIAILGWWVFQQIQKYNSPEYVPMDSIQSMTVYFMVAFFVLLVLLQKLAWPRMKRQYHAYKKVMVDEALD